MWNLTPNQAAVLYGDAWLNQQAYGYQHWWALAERMQAVGETAPFKQNHEYGNFHISSIVDNGDGSYTITDSTSGVNWMTGAGHRRWVDATPGESGVPIWSATSFHAIIDADRTGEGLSSPDPRQPIRGPIFDNTTNTFRATLPVARWIKERRIPNLAALIGRHGWFLKTTGFDWTRAFITPANGPMWSFGKIKASTLVSGVLTIQSDRTIQHPSVVVGKELMFFAGGVLQRALVTAHDPTTSTLTASGATAAGVVGDSFYAVTLGTFWEWRGNDPTPTGPGVQCAWSGMSNTYYAHATGKYDNEKTTVLVARNKFPVRYAQTLDACPIDPEMWDVRASPDTLGRDPDTFIPEDNACGPGDILLMEKFYKNYRAIWSGWLWMCEKYCPRSIYDSDNPAFVSSFSIATALSDSGVNPINGVTGAVVGGGTSGVINCVLPVPFATPLWWSICDSTGKPIMQGYTTSYNGTTLSGGPFTTGVHNGKNVRASLGPTRWFERAFSLMKDDCYFLAGVDGTPPAAQPVSEAFPGTFYTVAKSTACLAPDMDGLVRQSPETRHQWQPNQYARWVGHRTYDPGFPILLPADVPDPLATFHNYGSIGTRTKLIEGRINSAKRGRATGGSNHRIEVKGLDFDGVDFFPNTNGKTHTFTPTTGGTTSCTVPGASGSNLWLAGRFPGFSGPMVGFCIEVLQSGSGFTDPAAVIEKRLIVTGTAGGAITWSEATSLTVVGKTCRIVEPMVYNPWKDWKVKVTKAGVSSTVLILGNRFDTLFVADPGFAVDNTTQYEIQVPKLGNVFKRNLTNDGWIDTAGMGADTRYGGATFSRNGAFNIGDMVKDYGLPLPMDRSQHYLAWHLDLYNFANNMTDMVGVNPLWKGYANDAVPEYNVRGVDGESGFTARGVLHTTYGHLDTPVQAAAVANWAASAPGSQDPAGGAGSFLEHFCDEEFAGTLGMSKSYGYLELQVHQLPEFFPIGYSTKGYVYATINGTDPGPDPGSSDSAIGGSSLLHRGEIRFDTSLGLPFRTWQAVGGGVPGTRIKVGGDINTMPDWVTTINESPINSFDHPSGTLADWDVIISAGVANRQQVHRFGFKYVAPVVGEGDPYEFMFYEG